MSASREGSPTRDRDKHGPETEVCDEESQRMINDNLEKQKREEEERNKDNLENQEREQEKGYKDNLENQKREREGGDKDDLKNKKREQEKGYKDSLENQKRKKEERNKDNLENQKRKQEERNKDNLENQKMEQKERNKESLKNQATKHEKRNKDNFENQAREHEKGYKDNLENQKREQEEGKKSNLEKQKREQEVENKDNLENQAREQEKGKEDNLENQVREQKVEIKDNLEHQKREQEKEKKDNLENQESEQEVENKDNLENQAREQEKGYKDNLEHQKREQEKEKKDNLENQESEQEVENKDNLENQAREQEKGYKENLENQRREQDERNKDNLENQMKEQEGTNKDNLENQKKEHDERNKDNVENQMKEQEERNKDNLENQKKEQEGTNKDNLENQKKEQEGTNKDNLENQKKEQEGTNKDNLENQKKEQEGTNKDNLENQKKEQEERNKDNLENQKREQEEGKKDNLENQKKEQEGTNKDNLENQKKEQEGTNKDNLKNLKRKQEEIDWKDKLLAGTKAITPEVESPLKICAKDKSQDTKEGKSFHHLWQRFLPLLKKLNPASFIHALSKIFVIGDIDWNDFCWIPETDSPNPCSPEPRLKRGGHGAGKFPKEPLNAGAQLFTAQKKRTKKSRGTLGKRTYHVGSLFLFIFLYVNYASSLRCPSGTHLYEFYDGHPDVCVECQHDNFMPAENHQHTECRPCEKIEDSRLEILVSKCTKTHDAIIQCVDGYFREQARNPRETGTCQKCTQCSAFMFASQSCGTYTDTVCCMGENFDVIPNQHGVPLCRERPWFCRQGQYFETDGFQCLPCPTNTFMPADFHVHPECFKCRDYTAFEVNRPLHSVIVQPCSSTHDTVLRCKDGFFMNHFMGFRNDAIGCSPCTDCSTTDVKYEGCKCDSVEDTVCCPHLGMEVFDTAQGPVCKGHSPICSGENCLWFKSWKRFSNCAPCDLNILDIDLDESQHEQKQEADDYPRYNLNFDSAGQSQSSKTSQQTTDPVLTGLLLIIAAAVIGKGKGVRMTIAILGFLSYQVVSPQMTPAITCPSGTHLLYYNGADICIECPDETVMPFNDHQYRKCKKCEKIEDPKLEILVSPCSNKTHDSVIHCVEGYYRDLARNPDETGTCKKCTECSKRRMFTGQRCSTYRDTICCYGENFDVVPNHKGIPMCRERPWFCRRGQYFETKYFTCLPCPSNTFMHLDHHVRPECFKCRDYNKYETYRPINSVIDKPCNSTHDTVLRCRDGFFRKYTMGYRNDAIGCSPCTDCSTTDVQYEGRKCDSMRDTVCCPQANMTVFDTPEGPRCWTPSRADQDDALHEDLMSSDRPINCSSDSTHNKTAQTCHQESEPGLMAALVICSVIFGILLTVIIFVAVLHTKNLKICTVLPESLPVKCITGTDEEEAKVMLTSKPKASA